MTINKLVSGSQLPEITLSLIKGGEMTLGQPHKKENWQLIFFYRGLHCPLCKKYLQKLESLKDKFLSKGAEVVAVSGDPKDKAMEMVKSAKLSIPVCYNLSTQQMKKLGLYISNPRSPEETDLPFPEPGMFAVNAEGKIHLIDVSNTPFNRSDLGKLIKTIGWIKENDYPIRGTYE